MLQHPVLPTSPIKNYYEPHFGNHPNPFSPNHRRQLNQNYNQYSSTQNIVNLASTSHFPQHNLHQSHDRSQMWQPANNTHFGSQSNRISHPARQYAPNQQSNTHYNRQNKDPATQHRARKLSFNSGQSNPVESINNSQKSTEASQTQPKREILMFVASDEKHSICYPNWWNKVEIQEGQVLFIAPRTSSQDFCDNISVVVEDLSNKTSYNDLYQYTQVILQSLYEDPEIQVIQTNPTSLCGLEAHEVVYSARHYNKPIIFKQVWIIYQNRAYIVTYTSDAAKYVSTSHELANEIMNSFRLLPPPVPVLGFGEDMFTSNLYEDLL